MKRTMMAAVLALAVVGCKPVEDKVVSDKEPLVTRAADGKWEVTFPEEPRDATYHRGFQDGWMAFSLDQQVVSLFHARADALPDDADPVALERAWQGCLAEGKSTEAQWQKMTQKDKDALGLGPFWKSGKGMPQRLTKAQRAEQSAAQAAAAREAARVEAAKEAKKPEAPKEEAK